MITMKVLTTHFEIIKLEQVSHKSAQHEKGHAVLAHQLCYISLLENVLSSKYTLFLSSETLILFSCAIA
jgi:hypothetical protein